MGTFQPSVDSSRPDLVNHPQGIGGLHLDFRTDLQYGSQFHCKLKTSSTYFYEFVD